jgi:hypothetical protein
MQITHDAQEPGTNAGPNTAWGGSAHKRARLFAPQLIAALVCLAATGCVERRLTIRTNPPGALLYVDDYEIGTTPVSTSVTYYGTRKIRLVKDGYETLTTMQWIPPPWYEYFPMDFVAENFVPGQICDQRTLDFQLKPQTIVPTDQLLARAEALRRGIQTVPGSRPPPGFAPARPAAPVPPSGPAVISPPEGIGGQPIHPLPQ